MKKIKYLLVMFLVLLLNSSINKNIVSIVNIDLNKDVFESNTSGVSLVPVKIVSVSDINIRNTYYVGETQALTGTCVVRMKKIDDNGQTEIIDVNMRAEYSSGDSSVLSINDNNLRAVGSGTTGVIIYPSGYPSLASSSYSVTVKSVLNGVSFNSYASNVIVGQSLKLNYTLYPSGVEVGSTQWKSSNTNIATVDTSGNVRFLKPGNVNITLTVSDMNGGTKSANASFVVKSNLTTVNLINTISTLNVNSSTSVNFSVSPAGAYYETATWSSSNTSVATINLAGVISAKKVGTTTITLTVKKGDGSSDIIKNFSLQVLSNLTDASIGNSTSSMKIGEYRKLNAILTPTNASYHSINWSSSNTGVASIDSSGGLTAKSVGNTVITMTIIKGDNTSNITRSFNLQVISNLTDVTVSPTSINMPLGSSKKITYSLNPTNGYYQSINWSSSNSSIASVDSNGNVTARGIGKTTIVLSINRGSGLSNLTKNIPVTVEPVKATSVYVTPSSYNLNVNESINFTATVYPSNATIKSVTWSSNDPSIATVNQSGYVTAKSPGSTKICVRHQDLSSSYCSNVNVNPITATSIFYQGEDDIILVPGSTMTINYAIIPSNVTNTNHRLVSSNTDVIHVIDDHTVKAVGKGNSTVRIISGDGIVSKSIYFYVPPSNASGHLVLHISGGNSLDVGATARIFYSVIPSGQTAGTVSYSSGNNSIATVTSDGYITGVRPGNVTISAVSSKGFVGSATITVRPASTGISINNHKTIIKANETLQLYTSYTPSNSSGFTKTWVSSNEEVATVSSNGKVTGIKEGTVTITVKNSDGSISNTTNIVVINPIDYVVSRQGDMEMALGESKKIEYDILPEEATPRSFVWKTSNAGVATVSDDGTVTIISPGEAVISVETEDGDVFEVTTVRTAGASHGAVDPDAEGQVDDDPPLPETVDNPKTGLTISIICVIIFMIGLVVFKISGKYFNRIKKI